MIIGQSHAEGLRLFRTDPETDCVILLGEIGGTSEEDAAEYIIRTNYPKPVFAYIAGLQAPVGKKMGHAGAIISGGKGTATSKAAALRAANVRVAESVGNLVELISEENKHMGGRLMTVEPIRDLD